MKDGRFNSTKFRGKRCELSASNRHPHAIILSNQKPNVKALSFKRWRVGYVEYKDSKIVWYKVMITDACVVLPSLKNFATRKAETFSSLIEGVEIEKKVLLEKRLEAMTLCNYKNYIRKENCIYFLLLTT